MLDEKLAVYIDIWLQDYKVKKNRKKQIRDINREMRKERKLGEPETPKKKSHLKEFLKSRTARKEGVSEVNASLKENNDLRGSRKKSSSLLRKIVCTKTRKISMKNIKAADRNDSADNRMVSGEKLGKIQTIREKIIHKIKQVGKLSTDRFNKARKINDKNKKYKKVYGLLLFNVIIIVLLISVINIIGRPSKQKNSDYHIAENIEKGTLTEPESKTRELGDGRDLTDNIVFDNSMINITAEDGKDLHPAVVNKIVDGDTLICNIDGREEYVRLNLIDTPESVNPDSSKNTEYGKYASEHTKNLVNVGDTVFLQYDEVKRDKYNRILAYVWLKEWVDTESMQDIEKYMLNYIILADGYAKVLVVDNKAYEELFYETERLTRNRRIGLFQYNEYRKVS